LGGVILRVKLVRRARVLQEQALQEQALPEQAEAAPLAVAGQVLEP